MIMFVTSDNIKSNMELRNSASFWLSPVQAITTPLFNKPFARKTPVIKIKWKKSKAVYTWVRSSFQWYYCIRSYGIHQIDPRKLVKTHVNIESYEIKYISNNIVLKRIKHRYIINESKMLLKVWSFRTTPKLKFF